MLNVGTNFQVADILTKLFPEPKKWEHALRLIGIGATKIPRCRQKASPVVSAAGHQGGPQRLLIEFCCAPDSKLCTPRDASKGCKCIRVTEKEDGTTESCRSWIAREVKTFREKHPKGKILLYTSLPCVGGSPWGNINGLTEKGEERIQQQQKEFSKLFKSLAKLIDQIKEYKISIAFELSRNCKYWRWPIVRAFLVKHGLGSYNFDGCMFGVVGRDGNPMKKSWTIATNMEQLSCLEKHRCDGMHAHDQSRGVALKLAEGYTFELTDLIHGCFRQLALAQDPPKRTRLALPAMSREATPIVRSIAPSSARNPAEIANQTQAAVTGELESPEVMESNIKWWNKVFVQSITSYYQMVLGPSEQQRETTEGILRTFTPQSAFEICCLADDEPLFEAMRPLARVSREALGRIPKGIDARSPIWLFVSDSGPCMVTGKGRTPKKYPIDQVLSERRPGYVAAFKHDMLWGQDLRRIIIRSIELVAEARAGNPDAPIVLVAMWNGNELVGKRGINPQQHWPFEEPEGHYPDILEDLKRRIRWFKMKCNEHKVEVAGLMAEPDCFFYNLLGPFQAMIKTIKEWFHEEFASDLYSRFR